AMEFGGGGWSIRGLPGHDDLASGNVRHLLREQPANDDRSGCVESADRGGLLLPDHGAQQPAGGRDKRASLEWNRAGESVTVPLKGEFVVQNSYRSCGPLTRAARNRLS